MTQTLKLSNYTGRTELPPIESDVSVRLLEGVIVTGVVTGHGQKDGKPTFDFEYDHRTPEGQILKASKWAWPEQVQRNQSKCKEPSPSRASGHTAYEATAEDVEVVLSSNALAVVNTYGKSFESMAEELHGDLDFGLIEQAALAGDDLDEQTEYANDEIARQLREMGVLEPLKPACDSPSLGM